ncbi:MAG: glutamine-hydrolyzing carbamoyl-phosphate synthase small subunit [Candidatus Diapherotrites archaeon]
MPQFKGAKARLILEDNSVFHGMSFGAQNPCAGEVVFNTGMTGYEETLSDPSYSGQILVFSYPLIGNYGVRAETHGGFSMQLAEKGGEGFPVYKLNKKFFINNFESERVQTAGVIVSDYSGAFSHHAAERSLGSWLAQHEVPAITGIDTRALTKRLRERGTMLGRIEIDDVQSERGINFHNPNKTNLVDSVCIKEPVVYESAKRSAAHIAVLDCGVKNNILRMLLTRGLKVTRLPWDYDFNSLEFDALILSNGPGDPKMLAPAIANVRRALEKETPAFGICLGNQLLALAAGADTYKMKYGHRSQNQPALLSGTKRCYITSQNHGFAVNEKTLPKCWEPWFTNLNDGTNEGIRHKTKPFMSVQFHPEATPGPVDTAFLFDEFLEAIK